jgi:2-hydroxychromene-2-carboxylate isomerase
MKPKTRIKSIVTRFIASNTKRDLLRTLARVKRSGQSTVHYFHQVDDPYSHMAAQKLEALQKRYRVNFEYHLVSAPSPDEQGDSSRFQHWALRDARSVAEYYGTDLPREVAQIDPSVVIDAQQYLSTLLNSAEFPAAAVNTGGKIWSGKAIGPISGDANRTAEGNALRTKLGHYLSGTFYFEGEWYWGLDRLFHLENRLCDMFLSYDPSSLCVPRPLAEELGDRDAAAITLEFFPSLRSPYTAISFDRVIDMVERTGVQLQLRPVMPMMMRGVPAPRVKQLYIVSDTRREADYYDQSFGKIVDPIGEPVKRAFSLFPYMAAQGLGIEYCSAYLKAAWVNGEDITTDAGLQQIVERVGGNWEDARHQFDNDEYKPLLEANVADMLEAGLWGVPSFRLTGGNIEQPFACWGQDRLWRVETEICKRAT